MLSILVALAAAAQAPARPELEPMRFLIGHCWRGQLSAKGEQDTHCFESVFDGQHIRDRHEVKGAPKPYSGETIYSWNAKLGRVEYTYWNSIGGVSRGTMVPQADRLTFDDQIYTGADGKQMAISTFWRKIDDGAYESVTVSKANPTGDRIVRYRRVD